MKVWQLDCLMSNIGAVIMNIKEEHSRSDLRRDGEMLMIVLNQVGWLLVNGCDRLLLARAC